MVVSGRYDLGGLLERGQSAWRSLKFASWVALLASVACGRSDDGTDVPPDATGGTAGDSGDQGGTTARGGTGGDTRGGSAGSYTRGGGSAGDDSRGGSAGDDSRGGSAGDDSRGGSAGDDSRGGTSATGGRTSGQGGAGGQAPVDKLDLLFMIDNSISMTDKQGLLAKAVPELVHRLVNPLCVNAQGRPSTPPTYAQDNGSCANATLSPEFSPLQDIHIGVLSSSLGGHGGVQLCALPTDNDNGQLLGIYRNPNNIPTYDDRGFLAWDPGMKYMPPGETNSATLVTNFSKMVSDVGQKGCGYEASLEAWYRFLIDTQPPMPNGVTNDGASTVVVYNSDPILNPVLAQRRLFLRDDSLVAIVMLTDENDCSIKDEGQGWLIATTQFGTNQFRMFKGTAACQENPNDRCCVSCGVAPSDTPSGCPSTATPESGCMNAPQYLPQEDTANLRCFDQKKRFGIDLLYPTQRYVDGLSESTIVNRDGAEVPNPLFASNPPRDKSRVFFAGIIGVPWQDISTEESWAADAPLEYLSYTELLSSDGNNRWDWILGSPGNATTPPELPLDPLMIETTADRSAAPYYRAHPGALPNADPQPPTAQRTANPINGHESTIADNSDLQFACTFDLPTPMNCTEELKSMSGTCDCYASDAKYNRSLCDGTIQRAAKAYPGVRHLRVLKDFGAKGTHNSIVASICPKTMDANDPSYGYNPAVSAIVNRLKEALQVR